MEPVTPQEVYEIIRGIKDPEHPATLEELGVVSPSDVSVSTIDGRLHITVDYAVTVPDCQFVVMLGLSIRVALVLAFPADTYIFVRCKTGTHDSAEQLDKQINDKERASAALRNPRISALVDECLADVRDVLACRE